MRPDRVVVASPALDDDLGLAQSVEDLAVEQLIAKAGVEALDVAVLLGPRRSEARAAENGFAAKSSVNKSANSVSTTLAVWSGTD